MLAQGLCKAEMNLQPWRTQLELARHLSMRGWSVSVLSDQPVNGLHSGEVQFDFVEEWNASSLGQHVSRLAPSAVIWTVAPTSIRHSSLLDKIDCPVFPLSMSPAYSWRQILGVALRCDLHELRSLLLQQCIPAFLWRRFLMHDRIRAVYVMSENSLKRLLSIGIINDRATILRAGLDEDLRALALAPEAQGESRKGTRYLYLGSPKKIRGFHMLLNAIERLGRLSEAKEMEFRLLARGSQESLEGEVLSRLGRVGMQVSVETGTLQRTEVLDEIRKADVVLLPFLLAPSDVPIAVLEAMALGTPVISTLIDGIPELVEGRGKLLKRRTSAQLARAMLEMHQEPLERVRLGVEAKRFASRYPTWAESLNDFTEHLEGKI